MKHVFLGLFALLAYTTAMMWPTQSDRPATHAVQNIGYSQDDRDMLNALTERATKEARATKRHKVLSGSDERAALQELYGVGQ